MTIDSSSGLIQWTPVIEGDVNVTVQAHNGNNPTATQSFVISVSVPPVIPSGLVGYWNLNEASGNTYSDFTGINNGTGNVSPTAVTGQVGGAQLFDGTTNKIDVPANPSFDFAANANFSLEFWYKGNDIPSTIKAALSREISGTEFWWVGVNANDGRARFTIYVEGKTISAYGSIITDGIWHHVAATRNGTTGQSKIYVDGNLKSTVTIPFNSLFSSSTAKLQIGSFRNNFVLNGSLDEVAVHNIELSPAEIQQHFNKGVSGLSLTKSNQVKDHSSISPKTYNVAQNFPNPFNPSTTISYELPYESRVSVQIFNIIGEHVANLLDDVQAAGYYNLKWDASDLPSGIYLLRIDAQTLGTEERFVKTVKMLLMK